MLCREKENKDEVLRKERGMGDWSKVRKREVEEEDIYTYIYIYMCVCVCER